MKNVEKKEVFLSLDQDSFLELKRALFKNGLTIHQFFGYIIDRLSLNDSRLSEILIEAHNFKKQRTLDGKEKKPTPEVVYSLIEEELRRQLLK